MNVKLQQTYEGETWQSLHYFDDEYDLQAYIDDKEGLGAAVKVLSTFPADYEAV